MLCLVSAIVRLWFVRDIWRCINVFWLIDRLLRCICGARRACNMQMELSNDCLPVDTEYQGVLAHPHTAVLDSGAIGHTTLVPYSSDVLPNAGEFHQSAGDWCQLPYGSCHGTSAFSGSSIPMGQGGHVPPIFGLGDIITNVPPIFLDNISYFLSMQYFLDKLKEFLVFLVFSRLVQGVVGTL